MKSIQDVNRLAMAIVEGRLRGSRDEREAYWAEYVAPWGRKFERYREDFLDGSLDMDDVFSYGMGNSMCHGSRDKNLVKNFRGGSGRFGSFLFFGVCGGHGDYKYYLDAAELDIADASDLDGKSNRVIDGILDDIKDIIEGAFSELDEQIEEKEREIGDVRGDDSLEDDVREEILDELEGELMDLRDERQEKIDELAMDLLSERENISDYRDLPIDHGEVSWDLQRWTAEAAVSLGYDGVNVDDEHGTSTMIDMSKRDVIKQLIPAKGF